MQAEDIFPSGKNKEKFSKNSNCSCREFKKAVVKIVKNPNVKWGMKNQEVDEEGELIQIFLEYFVKPLRTLSSNYCYSN